MRHVLILGGSGHLGAALRERARVGTQITATHTSRPFCGSLLFRLEDAEPLPKAAIAIGSFPLARQLEGRSETEIDDAVRDYIDRCKGARIVQLSTDAVFSGTDGLYDESDQVNPTTAYGRAQAGVDAALLKYAPDCLIVRTSFIFGWAGKRFDKRLSQLVQDDAALHMKMWPSNIYRGPTEVNFLAEGIWRAIERGTTGILNIAGPRFSIYDFFVKALREFGSYDMPAPHDEMNDGVARDTSLHTARMERELDLKAKEVWEWYRLILQRRDAC